MVPLYNIVQAYLFVILPLVMKIQNSKLYVQVIQKKKKKNTKIIVNLLHELFQEGYKLLGLIFFMSTANCSPVTTNHSFKRNFKKCYLEKNGSS